MSQPSSRAPVEVVRSLYEEQTGEVLHPDVRWHRMNFDRSLERLVEGLEEFGEYFAAGAEATAGDWQMVPISITPAGNELVIVHGKTAGSIGNVRVDDLHWVNVVRVVDGVIVQIIDAADRAFDTEWVPLLDEAHRSRTARS